MRLRHLPALLLAVSALSACAQQMPQYAAMPARYEARSDLDARMYGAPQRAAYAMVQPGGAATARAAKPFLERPYTLDAGDKLRVVVFGQDSLSNSYTVGADGAVTLPLIGAVPARGLTTTQLSGAVAGRLRQGYIREPSVAVEVETYRPFFVLGEVTYPGQYPYVPNMTVEAAIAVAGGFTPRADKDRVVVKRNARGAAARYAMPLQNPVQPGDTVTVAERWF
jgi:polysaccharide export outer membrane protein